MSVVSPVLVRTAGLLIAAALTGCSAITAEPVSSPAPSSEPSATVAPSSTEDTDQLVAQATVLDDGSGPELCVGIVLTSFPPQCSGPPITGWAWPKAGTERSNGVTWGEWFVVGRYDGKRFAFDQLLTKDQAAASLPADPDPDFTSPCPPPPGGWRAVDPTLIGEDDQQRVFERAEHLSGYAASWVDDQGNDAQPAETTVVNVQVTGSTTAAEQQLRTVWGGPLCVSTAHHTEHELKQILGELAGKNGMLSGDLGRDVVDLEVVYDDGSLQSRFDRRYGRGLVRVSSALRPYRG